MPSNVSCFSRILRQRTDILNIVSGAGAGELLNAASSTEVSQKYCLNERSWNLGADQIELSVFSYRILVILHASNFTTSIGDLSIVHSIYVKLQNPNEEVNDH